MEPSSFYRLCERHISRPRSALDAAAYRAGKGWNMTEKFTITQQDMMSSTPKFFYQRTHRRSSQTVKYFGWRQRKRKIVQQGGKPLGLPTRLYWRFREKLN